ncbi:hypothetical protein JMT66_23680 (plasmid) [Kosakonia cowanii]|uniref:Hha/YmoA family nucleoid-associated regulatory protein n=1 Tax=Kosakonia cowanii TaxID=208223 RepID=UPI003B9ED571|nr:hypothetical protein JMT66_23680 [Kosakonia cowanii]
MEHPRSRLSLTGLPHHAILSKCSSSDMLERVPERLKDKLPGHDLDAMMSASDHR